MLGVAFDNEESIQTNAYGTLRGAYPVAADFGPPPCAPPLVDSFNPACVARLADGAARRREEAEAQRRYVEEQKAWLENQRSITESLEQSWSGAPSPSRGSGGGKGDWWDIVAAACARYGCDPDALYRVLMCESGGDANAYNPSDASGCMQFMPGTWASTPYAGRSIYDCEAQIYAAAWMWSQGRRGEWVC